jgi:tRNA (cmo5U34)-methyltransferase
MAQSNLEEMSAFFDARADSYDQHMHGLLEDFETFYRTFARQIAKTDLPVRILNLGAGTGNELEYIWERTPNAHITAMDLSPLMLKKLVEKYGNRKPDLTLICGSYLDTPFGTGYDYIVSVYTMHHFPPGIKAALYRKIYGALLQGGRYVEGDCVSSAGLEQKLLEHYSEAVAPLPQDSLYHIDIPLSIERQLLLLKEAGFPSPVVWMADRESAIFTAGTAEPTDSVPAASASVPETFLSGLTRHWPLPYAERVDGLCSGSKNVYRLQLMNKSVYYAKRLPSLELITREQHIKAALVGSGVRTAKLVQTRSGAWHAEWAGSTYVLYEELSGRVPDRILPSAETYGQGIAHMHKGLLALGNMDSLTEMNLIRQLRDWAFPATLSIVPEGTDRILLVRLAEDMEDRFFPMAEKLDVQPIHRDTNLSNLLLDDEGMLGVLDFDISTRGYRLFDLCYFATSVLAGEYQPGYDYGEWLQLFQALVKGYQEISPLTAVERASLFDILCAVQWIFSAFFTKQGQLELASHNRSILLDLSRLRESIIAITA